VRDRGDLGGGDVLLIFGVRDLRGMESTRREVTAVLNGIPYRTLLTARGITAIADEPSEHGGQDAGLRPHELLLSALASCTAITLRMYADRKQWDVGGISVHAAMDRTQEGRAIESRIHVEVTFGKELPAEHRERLLQIAGACPVHRTLESPITLTRSLKP
jgi:putative redox protein